MQAVINPSKTITVDRNLVSNESNDTLTSLDFNGGTMHMLLNLHHYGVFGQQILQGFHLIEDGGSTQI
jgi:hypothetical protein